MKKLAKMLWLPGLVTTAIALIILKPAVGIALYFGAILVALGFFGYAISENWWED